MTKKPQSTNFQLEMQLCYGTHTKKRKYHDVFNLPEKWITQKAT